MSTTASVADPLMQLRPTERVEQFLAARAARCRGVSEQRLPSAKQLAEQLDVSPRTVASVYREMAKRGVLRTRVGDGTFLISEASDNGPVAVYRVGLSIPRLESNDSRTLWTNLLCGGILGAASQWQPPAMVLALAGEAIDEHLPGRVVDQRDTVDGLILFPHPEARRIMEAYVEGGKPVVCLNPPTIHATADFVSPDYMSASRQIGQAFVTAGRRCVAYIFSGRLDRSVSSQLRLAGLTAGLGASLGRSCQLRPQPCDGPSEEEGYSAMRRLLAEGTAADAVYCAGDLLALGAIRAIEETGRRIPQDISVVGGTGYDLTQTACPMLTRCRQPLPMIGAAMMEMLRERLEQPAYHIPGRFVPLPFVGGSTTLPQENQILWQTT